MNKTANQIIADIRTATHDGICYDAYWVGATQNDGFTADEIAEIRDAITETVGHAPMQATYHAPGDRSYTWPSTPPADTASPCRVCTAWIDWHEGRDWHSIRDCDITTDYAINSAALDYTDSDNVLTQCPAQADIARSLGFRSGVVRVATDAELTRGLTDYLGENLTVDGHRATDRYRRILNAVWKHHTGHGNL